jgi:hypothetical protein
MADETVLKEHQYVDQDGVPCRSAFAAAAPAAADSLAGKTVVNLRMDGEVLARIDAEAKRLGISRTAWLHVAAHEKLKRERE